MGKLKSKKQSKSVKEPKPQEPESTLREPMCVFAFRLSHVDRGAIHAAAGRGRATQFVHAAVMAAVEKAQKAAK